MQRVDAIVIGTGQGGVPLAIELAREDCRVVVFERDRPGGSCTNRGCTPSKAFLGAAHAAGRARHSAVMGVHCDVRVDFPQVMKRVRKVRDRSMGKVVSRLDAGGVQLVAGEASFTTEGLVHGNQQTFDAPLIVINTGSRASLPPIEGLSDTPYLTDDNFWELQTLPNVTAVIGGGYIGLELGQGLARLGSEVHIFERGGRILSNESQQLSQALTEPLRDDGVRLHCNAELRRVAYRNNKFQLQGSNDLWEADALLVATGRTPNTEALKADAAGIELDDKGYIRVNEKFETSRPGVYAIGEAAGQPAFTHVAWEDYRRLLDITRGGGSRRRDDRVLGYGIFTEPQVGRAGWNVAQAEHLGYQVTTADMPVRNMARALEWGHEHGYYRIIAERDSGRILGAELVGYEAAELANLFIDLIEQGVTLETLGGWQHIHPTYAENLPSLARNAIQSAN